MTTITGTAGLRIQHARSRLRFAHVGRYVIVGILSIACMLPFFWMVSASFKTIPDMAHNPPTWLPAHPTLSNYKIALGAENFGRQVINSVIYAGGSTILALVFCSAAGYAFARLKFPGKKWVFGAVLGLLMVPGQSQIIPVFVILKHIPFFGGNTILGQGGTGLLNTYGGLMLPSIATPLGIFLMRQFFLGIPTEIEDSARIDGASTFTIYTRIILPLSRPALAALTIITFQNTWNEFIWPLIITNSDTMSNMQLGLQLYESSHASTEQTLMAASVLNVLPMIVVFLFAQRYFVGGLRLTGVQG